MISTLILLTAIEEQGLRVCDNMIMRKLFRPEREKGVKLWRKLCNELLHGLYTSLDVVRLMKEKEVEWMRRETNVRNLKKTECLEHVGIYSYRTLYNLSNCKHR
jgi:hypothetical protein